MASWRRSLLSAAAAACALLAVCRLAQAQSVVDQVIQQADNHHIGSTFKALSIFSGTPGISAANYYTDDLTLETFKLPLSYTFGGFEVGDLGRVAPYVEMTLGYLHGKQDFQAQVDPSGPTRIDSYYNAYTALGGVGIEVDLGDGFLARPIFLAGYSRVVSNANFDGPYAEEIEQGTKGYLFEMTVNSVLLGGALELDYNRDFASDMTFDAQARYDHFADKSYNASDPSLETTGNFGIFTGAAELKGPLGARLLDHDLRWIGFTSTTVLTGPESDDLGFQYFFELGGGLEFVDKQVVQGLQGFSLRSSAILGGGVIGWTAGLTLEF